MKRGTWSKGREEKLVRGSERQGRGEEGGRSSPLGQCLGCQQRVKDDEGGLT